MLTSSPQLSRASVTCLLGVEQGVADVHLELSRASVDVPVVVHEARGHGPDSAVPGQGC